MVPSKKQKEIDEHSHEQPQVDPMDFAEDRGTITFPRVSES